MKLSQNEALQVRFQTKAVPPKLNSYTRSYIQNSTDCHGLLEQEFSQLPHVIVTSTGTKTP